MTIPAWVHDPAQAFKVIQETRREAKAYRERLEASNTARIAKLKPEIRALVPKNSTALELCDWLDASEKVQTSE